MAARVAAGRVTSSKSAAEDYSRMCKVKIKDQVKVCMYVCMQLLLFLEREGAGNVSALQDGNE